MSLTHRYLKVAVIWQPKEELASQWQTHVDVISERLKSNLLTLLEISTELLLFRANTTAHLQAESSCGPILEDEENVLLQLLKLPK